MNRRRFLTFLGLAPIMPKVGITALAQSAAPIAPAVAYTQIMNPIKITGFRGDTLIHDDILNGIYSTSSSFLGTQVLDGIEKFTAEED